jgi:hypothetical protein
MTALRIGLVLALAIAATVVANIVLLGVATGSGDTVGKLAPRGVLVAPPRPRPTVHTPRPARPHVEPGEHSDD